MTRFRNTGKQVLQDDRHLADARDELSALMIVNALRALEDTPRKSTAPVNLNECRPRQEGDEMTCRCGLRWDVNDPDPPVCVHRATP